MSDRDRTISGSQDDRSSLIANHTLGNSDLSSIGSILLDDLVGGSDFELQIVSMGSWREFIDRSD